MVHKKIYFVVAYLFLAISYTLIGQPLPKDSTDAYNYWAKRGIIEMVGAFMNDYIVTVEDSKKDTNEIKGKKDFEISFLKDIDQKNVDQISFDFYQVSRFLKENHWRECEKFLFQPLKKVFENSNFIDSTFFTTKKPGSEKYSTDIPGQQNRMENWSNVQERILNSYYNQLKELAKKSRIAESQTQEHEPKEIEKNQKKTSQEIDLLNARDSKFDRFKKTGYISAFVIVFLMGGLLVFLLSRYWIYLILHHEKNRYIRELRLGNKKYLIRYIGLVGILKEHKDQYKKSSEEYNSQNQSNGTKELKRQIEILSKENEKFKRQNSNIKETDIESKESNSLKKTEYEWNIGPTKKSDLILYFSIPESNGQFIIGKGESSNDGRKFYRIEFSDNSGHGQLFFIPSDQDKRAINRLESYLKPVCEIENITNANSANRIELIEPGKVALINKSWIVDSDNKVKIKLI